MAVDLGTAEGRIILDVSGISQALNQATQQISSFQGRMQSFSDQMGNIGRSMSLAISGPLLGIGVAAAKVAVDYQSSMNVLKVASGATSDEMKQFAATAQALGADMELPATSAASAANAMVELSKAGMSVRDTLDAARGVLQLAAAASIDEARAAEITANALNAFGLAGTEASRVADLLAASANSSSGEITDVADALQMSSAVFASAKIPIEDLTTAIGLMANKGIMGSDAGTSLKQMLLALEAPTTKAAAVMNQYGISVYDAQGAMLPFRDIISQFSGKLVGLTDAQRNAALATIFGSDAVRAANIVMMGGIDAYDKMYEAVTKQGAAAEMARAKMQGLGGALEGLKSQIETALLAAILPFIDSMEGIVRGAAALVASFALIDPQLQKAIVAFAAVLAAAGPLALLLSGIAAAAAVLVTPFGAAALAVAAFAAAYASNFAGIRDATNRAVAGIQQFVSDVSNAFQSGGISAAAQVVANSIKGMVDKTIQAIQTGGPKIVSNLQAWAQYFGDWVGPAIPVVLGQLAGLGNQVISWIGEQAPKVATQLQKWSQQFGDWIGPAIPVVISQLAGLGNQVVSWIGEQAPKVATQLQKWAQQFGDWIGPAIPVVISQLVELGSQIISWIGEQAPKVMAQLQKWAQQFGDWVGPAIPVVLSKLGDLAIKMVQWIGEQLPELAASILKWATVLVDWITTDVLPNLPNELAKVAGKITGWIVTSIPIITVAALGFADALKDWIFTDLIPKIGPAFAEFLGALCRLVIASNDALGEAARQFAQGFLDGVGDTLKLVWEHAVKPGLDLAVQKIGEQVSQWVKAGQDLVQGLIDGVGSLAQKFVDKVIGMANSALQAAKDALGIKSPSLAFFEVGQAIGQGLINGLDSTRADVQKASVDIVGAVFAGFGGDLGINASSATGQFDSVLTAVSDIQDFVNQLAATLSAANNNVTKKVTEILGNWVKLFDRLTNMIDRLNEIVAGANWGADAQAVSAKIGTAVAITMAALQSAMYEVNAAFAGWTRDKFKQEKISESIQDLLESWNDVIAKITGVIDSISQLIDVADWDTSDLANKIQTGTDRVLGGLTIAATVIKAAFSTWSGEKFGRESIGAECQKMLEIWVNVVGVVAGVADNIQTLIEAAKWDTKYQALSMAVSQGVQNIDEALRVAVAQIVKFFQNTPAVRISENLQKMVSDWAEIVSVVAGVADSIKTLIDAGGWNLRYQALSMAVSQGVQNIDEALRVAVAQIVKFFKNAPVIDVSDETQKILAVWAATISAISGVIDSIRALIDVASWSQRAVDLQTKVSQSVNTLLNILQAMATEVVQLLQGNRVPAINTELQGMIQSWTNFVSAIASAIDNLSAIADYVSVGDITGKATSLANDLLSASTAIFNAVKEWTVNLGDGWTEAQKGRDTAIQLFGVVTGAIDALTSLKDYVTVGNLSGQATTLASDLILAATIIVEAMREWTVNLGDGWTESQKGRDIAIQLFGVVTSAIDALTSLKDYVTVGNLSGQAVALANDLLLPATVILDVLRKWVVDLGDGWVEAQKGRDAAIALFSTVTGAIDALKSLKDYVTVGDLSGQATALANDLVLAATTIFNALQDWVVVLDDGYNEAQKGRDAAIALFSTVTGAIDALKSLKDYVTVGDLSGQATALANDLVLAATAIFNALQDWVVVLGDGYNEAQKGRDAAIALFSTVTGAIDALKSLKDYVTVGDLSGQATALANDLVLAATAIFNALQDWVVVLGDGYNEAQKGRDAATALFSTVTGAIDALKSLKDYVTVGDLTGKARQLAADLKLAATAIFNALQDWKVKLTEGQTEAQKGRDAAIALFGTVTGAIDAIRSLSAYIGVGDLTRQAAQLASDLVLAATTLINGLRDYFDNLDVTPEQNEWVQRITTLVSSVSGMVDAIKSISEYVSKAGLIQKTRRLASDLANIASVLISSLSAFPDFTEAQSQLLQRVMNLVNGLAQVVDSLTRVGEFQGVMRGTVQAVINALITTMQQMSQAAGRLANETVTAAQVFLNSVQPAIEFLQESARLTESQANDVANSFVSANSSLSAALNSMNTLLEKIPAIGGSAAVAAMNQNGKNWLGALAQGINSQISSLKTQVDIVLNVFDWNDEQLATDGYYYGKDFIDGVADGLSSGMDTVRSKLQMLSDMLPHSPAKVGPLSEPVNWGYLIEGLSDVTGQAVDQVSSMAQQISSQLSQIGTGVEPLGQGLFLPYGYNEVPQHPGNWDWNTGATTWNAEVNQQITDTWNRYQQQMADVWKNQDKIIQQIKGGFTDALKALEANYDGITKSLKAQLSQWDANHTQVMSNLASEMQMVENRYIKAMAGIEAEKTARQDMYDAEIASLQKILDQETLRQEKESINFERAKTLADLGTSDAGVVYINTQLKKALESIGVYVAEMTRVTRSDLDKMIDRASELAKLRALDAEEQNLQIQTQMQAAEEKYNKDMQALGEKSKYEEEKYETGKASIEKIIELENTQYEAKKAQTQDLIEKEQEKYEIEKQRIEDLINSVAEIDASEFANNIISTLYEAMRSRIQGLRDYGMSNQTGLPTVTGNVSWNGYLSGNLNEAMRDLIRQIEALGGSISNLLPHSPAKEGPLSEPVNWVGYLTDGLSGAAQSSVKIVKGALRGISDLLPHSPAKEGPLSKPVQWDGYLNASGLTNTMMSVIKVVEDGAKTVADTTKDSWTRGMIGFGDGLTGGSLGKMMLLPDMDPLNETANEYVQRVNEAVQKAFGKAMTDASLKQTAGYAAGVYNKFWAEYNAQVASNQARYGAQLSSGLQTQNLNPLGWLPAYIQDETGMLIQNALSNTGLPTPRSALTPISYRPNRASTTTSNVTVNMTGAINVRKDSDITQLADEVARKIGVRQNRMSRLGVAV